MLNISTEERISNIVTKWGFPKGKKHHKIAEVDEWLGNFKDEEKADMLLILEKLEYFSSYEADDLVCLLARQLINIFEGEFSDVRFYSLGKFTCSSGTNYIYRLAKELGAPDTCFPPESFLTDDGTNVKAYVFVDDMIGSGKQAIRFAKDNFTRISKDIDKCYITLWALESGLKKVRKSSYFKWVMSAKVMTEEYRVFSDKSKYFHDGETRNKLKAICRRYGKKLFPGNSLGFENSQCLLAFQHNVPNNTLPIIWAGPDSDSAPYEVWRPVFKRQKNETKIRNKKTVSNFLELIGQSNYGALIDRIFVEPDEYREIKKTLETQRIVIITGLPGYGKTYVAIRLLWEWYNNRECTPKWISGKIEKNLQVARNSLIEIETTLKPNSIIYFEEPFRITRYKSGNDLPKKIENIITAVRNKEKAYVIITLREEIFKQFKIRSIKTFTKKLCILKLSYSDAKRKKMLELWAREKKCPWIEDNKLREMGFNLFKQCSALLSPLRIYDFVEATIGIDSKDKLGKIIDTYSMKPEIAYSNEIKELHDSGKKDRILFLSIIFVSECIEVNLARKIYENLRAEGYDDFYEILETEHRIKNTTQNYEADSRLEFYNPLYSKAFQRMLDISECRNIFRKVLTELSRHDSTVWDVAMAITNNFNKLSISGGELDRYINKFNLKKMAGPLAIAIIGNCHMFPQNKFSEILKILCRMQAARAAITCALVRNLADKRLGGVKKLIPEHLQDKNTWDIARVVARQYNSFPEIIKKNLRKFGNNIGDIATFTAIFYKDLPKDTNKFLKAKVSQGDVVADDAEKAVVSNFINFSKKIQKSFILKPSLWFRIKFLYYAVKNNLFR